MGLDQIKCQKWNYLIVGCNFLGLNHLFLIMSGFLKRQLDVNVFLTKIFLLTFI